MSLVTIDMDLNTPKEFASNFIFLDHAHIPEDILSTAESWPRLELMTYTACYGELVYNNHRYTGVLYIDHEQRLLLEQLYSTDRFKEYKTFDRRLSACQVRRFKTKEEVEAKLKDILKSDLKYHAITYKIGEKNNPRNALKYKGHNMGPKNKFYSYKYQIKEITSPIFERYQLLLVKGWNIGIDQILNSYYFLNKEDPIADYIQESLTKHKEYQPRLSKL
jgi:hypothetical protein